MLSVCSSIILVPYYTLYTCVEGFHAPSDMQSLKHKTAEQLLKQDVASCSLHL